MNHLGHSIGWFVVAAPPVIAATILWSWHRQRGLPSGNRTQIPVLDLALALTLLGILAVTLVPQDGVTGVAAGIQSVPFASISETLGNSVSAGVAARIVGLNVVLFVPLGFVLALKGGRWAPAVGRVMVLSLAIETAQAVLPIGRTTNVDDVILNTAGGAIGAALALGILAAPTLHGAPRRRVAPPAPGEPPAP